MGSGQPNRPPQQIPVQPPRSPSPSNEPSYARPQKSRNASQSNVPHHGELESMLGDLQSDMTKQGVTTKTKGLCGACNKPVVGQVSLHLCFLKNFSSLQMTAVYDFYFHQQILARKSSRILGLELSFSF